MAQSSMTVMECDRCDTRLILDNKAPDADQVRRDMGRWSSLSHSHMGGTDSYLLCPVCWRAFIDQFLKNEPFDGEWTCL